MSYAPIDHEHDPFAIDPLRRDQWGRPLLIPAGGTEADRRPYTRASTLATSVTSDYGLHIWKIRRAVKGIADRPDLANLGSALPRLTGDRQTDAPVNRELDKLITEALVEAGALEAARHGTSLHGHTEPKGETRGPIPEYMKGDVASFFAKLEEHRLRIVETETFVACDELYAAGTFDHVVEHTVTGQRFILDKKTGAEPHMFEFLMQLAIYANGERYDPVTDARAYLDVSRSTGIVAHIPLGCARTDLYVLDLSHGMMRARQAQQIRADQANDAAVAWRHLG